MLPPPTPVVRYSSMYAAIRALLRAFDRHTLWAFNPQPELRSR